MDLIKRRFCTYWLKKVIKKRYSLLFWNGKLIKYEHSNEMGFKRDFQFKEVNDKNGFGKDHSERR